MKRHDLSDIFQQPQPDHVYVIAEIGSNHGGDLSRALALVDACAEAGADAAKFQSWQTALIQNPTLPESGAAAPAYPALKKYELPAEWHGPLKARCDERGIDFLSTPFDPERARLLRSLPVPAMKIASGDLTFVQLLEEVSDYGIPILLSTGMATLEEVASALERLGDARSRTVLLHCVGAYPPAFEDADLRSLQTLSAAFGLPVGISDHYPGHTSVVAAVALGARVVEKHVTFSRADGTPDSPFALAMDELRTMVSEIRRVEVMLGNGEKRCRPSEEAGRVGGRRSLYWGADLAAGAVVSEADMVPLRPAQGEFAPAARSTLGGRRLTRAVRAGQAVCRRDFADDG